VLDPQGPVAAGNSQILLNALAIMLMIVVPTLLARSLSLGGFAPRTKGDLSARVGLFGAPRANRLGIPLLVILFLSA